GELADATPTDAPRAALLWDIEDLWSIDSEVHAPGATHSALTLAAYEALVRAGYAVDVVDPAEDFSSYRLALAPAIHIGSSTRVRNIENAATSGTVVVIGPRSLVRTEDGVWIEQPFGGLNLGVRVADFGTPPDGLQIEGGIPIGPWAERLVPSEAMPILRYEETEWDGAVAAVRLGDLVYLGASSTEAWSTVLDRVLESSVTSG
ncbi:MAG: hypothetical protein HKN07_11145, partial [Acidimicrobiia bacterium]|nr:hypothetical protein [Acidimicrobiia bacterium]